MRPYPVICNKSSGSGERFQAPSFVVVDIASGPSCRTRGVDFATIAKR
jgi:hypothetical protein